MKEKEFYAEVKNIIGMKSSESLFGITPSLPDTCPHIDDALHMINKIESATNYKSRWSESDFEDAVKESHDIAYEIPDKLEKLRKMNSELREWGQQWKDLCKNIMFQNPSILIERLSVYIEDSQIEEILRLK